MLFQNDPGAMLPNKPGRLQSQPGHFLRKAAPPAGNQTIIPQSSRSKPNCCPVWASPVYHHLKCVPRCYGKHGMPKYTNVSYLKFPMVEFPPWRVVIPVVTPDSDPCSLQGCLKFCTGSNQSFPISILHTCCYATWHNYHLKFWAIYHNWSTRPQMNILPNTNHDTEIRSCPVVTFQQIAPLRFFMVLPEPL